jgi:CBS domain-containing protein
MTRAVARIDVGARLPEVARKLAAVEAGALAVGTTDSIVGMISERDITRAFGRREGADEVLAGDIASADLIWCRPDCTAADAARIMAERGVRHLLVGESGTGALAGIVSARDLIEALVAEV